MFYLVVGAIQAAWIFGGVYRIFDFDVRCSSATLAAFSTEFLVAVVALALAASALFARREAALQVLLYTSIPMVFVAGFSWPVEGLPPAVRTASLLLPSTAGIEGYLKLAQMGAGLDEVRGEAALLLVLAVVYFAAACAGEWWTARISRSRPDPR